MKNKTIPDYLLERYLLEELPAAKMREIGELAQHDPAVMARVRKIRESSAGILRDYPPEMIVPQILHRVPARSVSSDSAGPLHFSRRYIAISSLAVASLALFFMIFSIIQIDKSGSWSPFEKEEITRVKGGGTRIYVYRKINHTAILLADNNRVHEKDLLQIAYFSAEDTHGVIISIDGRGTVTIHYPARQSAGTRIEKNRKILLGSSYELDDAPGFERFFFITSRKPVDMAQVRRAAAELTRDRSKIKNAGLPLDSSYRQYSLLLRKN